jgi:ActR/RegA family two-component response regulator
MATDSREADALRARLDDLGRKRSELTEDEMQLSEEITSVLRDAKGVIPKSEAARRLGLHRTTLYRVYDDDE